LLTSGLFILKGKESDCPLAIHIELQEKHDEISQPRISIDPGSGGISQQKINRIQKWIQIHKLDNNIDADHDISDKGGMFNSKMTCVITLVEYFCICFFK